MVCTSADHLDVYEKSAQQTLMSVYHLIQANQSFRLFLVWAHRLVSF